MSIKKLADEIQSIYDSGDCGKSLSDVLEMAIELNNKPSDLEIVQKALDKIKLVDHRSANVDFFGNGSWVVWNYSINAAHQVADGSDLESLLTWAKQTVGYDRCPSHDSEQP